MKLRYFPLIFLHLVILIKIITGGFVSSPDTLYFLLFIGFPVMILVFISNIYLTKKEGNHYMRLMLFALAIIAVEFAFFREMLQLPVILVNSVVIFIFSMFFAYRLKLTNNKPLSYKTPGIILILIILMEAIINWTIHPPYWRDILNDIKIIFAAVFYSIPFIILIFFSNKYSLRNKVNCYVRLPIVSIISVFIVALIEGSYIYFTCSGESCMALFFLPVFAGIYLIFLVVFSLVIAYFNKN